MFVAGEDVDEGKNINKNLIEYDQFAQVRRDTYFSVIIEQGKFSKCDHVATI